MSVIYTGLAWESIAGSGYEFRAKVPGGWLIKIMEEVCHSSEVNPDRWGLDYRFQVIFVADRFHLWNPSSKTDASTVKVWLKRTAIFLFTCLVIGWALGAASTAVDIYRALGRLG